MPTETLIPNSELDRYAESVRLRIRLHQGELFPNQSTAHAGIIMREFISAATNRILIYCGALGHDVYQTLQDVFEGALLRGVEVKVLTSCPPAEIQSTDLAKWFVRTERPTCELRAGSMFRDCPHFAVVDDVMWRLELNQDSRRAVVCAYAAEDEVKMDTASKLVETFNTLWDNAKPVSMTEDGVLV